MYVSDDIVDDIRSALNDLGSEKQLVADAVSMQLGPEKGAALIRLFIASAAALGQGSSSDTPQQSVMQSDASRMRSWFRIWKREI